jgi:hypothetical protein
MSASWIQSITAGRGHQQPAVGRIAFDFLAQPVNVGFQGMRRHAGIVTPNLIQQDLPRHHAVGMPIQEFQDIDLFRGQPDASLLVCTEQQLGGWAEGVWPDGEDRVLAGVE